SSQHLTTRRAIPAGGSGGACEQVVSRRSRGERTRGERLRMRPLTLTLSPLRGERGTEMGEGNGAAGGERDQRWMVVVSNSRPVASMACVARASPSTVTTVKLMTASANAEPGLDAPIGRTPRPPPPVTMYVIPLIGLKRS